MQIVWIGGIFDENTSLHRPAVSPAGVRWQRGFLQGLRGASVGAQYLGHLPEPLWPRGQCWIAESTGVRDQSVPGTLVPYWNLPIARPFSIVNRYVSTFKILCQKFGKPDALLSYNLAPQCTRLGTYARELGIPWISFIADQELSNFWESYRALTQDASGHVFLSWGAFQDCPSSPKYHLDGGIDDLRTGDPRRNGTCRIVYTGALSSYAGVSLLVNAFKKLRREDRELIICGKGWNADVAAAAKSDNRIHVMGAVPERELERICADATLFVNPRPASVPCNEFNFPSKILEYLSYGKPVVSTWTKGLAPSYHNVLSITEGDSPLALAAKIDEIASWDITRYRRQCERIQQFVVRERLWNVQIRRFMDWMKNNVLRT